MTNDPFTLTADMVDLGGFTFVPRAVLADALIRSGYLTPSGLVPGKGLLGGIRQST
jgi:hypothetical protein